MWSSQIDAICESSTTLAPHYRGSFGKTEFERDRRKYLEKNSLNLFIVNSKDPTSGPVRDGLVVAKGHWTLFYNNTAVPYGIPYGTDGPVPPEGWFFFDSLARSCTASYGFRLAGDDGPVKHVSPFRLQASNTCGLWCIYAAEVAADRYRIAAAAAAAGGGGTGGTAGSGGTGGLDLKKTLAARFSPSDLRANERTLIIWAKRRGYGQLLPEIFSAAAGEIF